MLLAHRPLMHQPEPIISVQCACDNCQPVSRHVGFLSIKVPSLNSFLIFLIDL